MSAVMDVIRSGWIGTGKVSHQFEEEFADFHGGGHAVAVSSCTMGLLLSLKALGLGESEELCDVITTPLTFAATLNAIEQAGAYPILADVDDTGCIDPIQVQQLITEHTKAIIPVHYSGTLADVGHFRPGIPIVEDCAHAFGADFKWRGISQVFSFYANKNITCGEGGMVLSRDKGFADHVRILSAQGLSKGSWARYGRGSVSTYSVEKIGFKGNMPDLLASIGLVQLRRWPEMKKKRERIFDIYQMAFGEMPEGHSTHFYPLRVKNRDLMREKLNEKGIGTGIHYKPLHLEPAYHYYGYKLGDFPEAEKWGEEEMSLPVSPKMTEDDAFRVVKIIKGELNATSGY